MKHAVGMVYLAMPDGIDRNEILQEYAVEVGVTMKKAEEHFELLESTGMLRYDDLRYYTTPKGLRFAGFARDEKGELLTPSGRAEEKHREGSRANANAQKAASDHPNGRKESPNEEG